MTDWAPHINSISQRLTASDTKLARLELKMVDVDSRIDSRIKLFSDSLYKSTREGTVDVAARIETVRVAMSGQCDTDTSDNVRHLSLPVHVANMLDSLRHNRPGMFQALEAGAKEFHAGDPLNRASSCAAIVDRIMASAG